MEVGIGCGAGIASLAVLYKLLRPKFSVKVNCHFCNRNFKVSYGRWNSFTCPFCEQYNGFDKEGNYNKDLVPAKPQRFAEEYNQKIAKENGLCRQCNLNQELKISQLAASDLEGEDLGHYVKHLDRVYRLCPPCEQVLGEKILTQDRKFAPTLLQFKLEKSKFNLEVQLGKAKRMRPLLSLLSSIHIFTSVLLFVSLQGFSSMLEVLGTYFPLGISLEVDSYSFNAVLSFIIFFSSLSRRSFLLVLLHLCLLYCLLIPEVPHVLQLTLAGLTLIFSVISSEISNNPSSKNCKPVKTTSQRYFDNSYTESYPVENRQNLTVTNARQEETEEPLKLNRQSLEQDSYGEDKLTQSPRLLKAFDEDVIDHEFALDKDDDDCDLSVLSLGEDCPASPKATSPFTSKTYSPSFSNLALFSPKLLLRPSKLESKMTNRSWVAGGYWGQEGQDKTHQDPLSRSSSQSSGFFSATPSVFDLGSHPSPPPSLHNGFCTPPFTDRLSVVSEPFLRARSPLSHVGPKDHQYANSVAEFNYTYSSTPHLNKQAVEDKLSDYSGRHSQPREPLHKDMVGGNSLVSAVVPSPWTLTLTITPTGLLLLGSIAINVAVVVSWAMQS